MRSIWVIATVAAVLVSLAGEAVADKQRKHSALKQPAFAAKPEHWLALAKRVAKAHPSASATVLLQEGHYDLRSDHSVTLRLRRVIRVATLDAVSDWSNVSVSWAPWYQDQPKIRARVISSSGRVAELDPDRVVVSAARGGSDHVYSDYRTVSAPIPGVGIGSVIEYELVIKDRTPMFESGDVHRFRFSGYAPIHSVRLTIRASNRLRIRTAAHKLPKLKRSKTKGKRVTTWKFSTTNVPATADIEPGMPSDVPRAAHVAFSTGQSWGAIAAGYSEVIDAQIAAGDISAVAKKLPKQTGNNRDEIVAAALALVHEGVRYTGLQLGQAAIVPWTPSETWSRKYGDCKDKATLLVALLRARGVSAHVALVRVGRPRDIESTLPGLGGFDHTIVYVRGKKPMWVDPTDDFSRAGQLPVSAQGRWALVAGPKTKRLVRTPRSKAADHGISELREISLPERGPARVVETSTYTGTFGRSYRADYRSADPKLLRERLETYVESEYGAKKLSKHEHTDPSDLDRPFQITLRAASTFIAADTDRATVSIAVDDLFDELSSQLTASPQAKPRKAALSSVPYFREIVYRCATPTGFFVGHVPAAESFEAGPISVAIRSKRTDGGVQVRLRLTVSRNRLTAKEVNAARKALPEIRNKSVQVVFRHTAQEHLSAGRIQQALAEIRRLIRLHPKEALHNEQLAEALLSVGLGAQARRAARRAVKLDPKSVDALGMLAWILQHDRFGRRFEPGWSRAGAKKAYEKALRIDPKSSWIRGNLGILLEYDASGRRYAGDMSAAAKHFRTITDAGDTTYAYNLLDALVHLGAADEMIKVAGKLPGSNDRSAYILAAAAIKGGKQALEKKLAWLNISTAERQAALTSAGKSLMGHRRYDLASLCFRLAAVGKSASAFRDLADIMDKVRPNAIDSWKNTDPRTVVAKTLERFAEGDAKTVLSLFSSRARSEENVDQIRQGMRRTVGRLGLKDAVAPGVVGDVVLSMLELKVGAKTARLWRVDITVPSSTSTPLTSIIVVKERGRFRLLGGVDRAAAIGAHAMDLLDKKHLEDARTLLDWATPALSDALVFGPLWKTGQPRTRTRAKLAAATLLAAGPGAARAIPVLEACKEKDKVALACDRALARAYAAADKPDKALAAVDGALERHPKDVVLAIMRPRLLVVARKLDVAEREAKASLAKDKDDDGALRTLARIDSQRGDLSAARARYAVLAGRTDATPEDLNMMAWLALFEDDVGDDVLDAAKRAVKSTNRDNPSVLHTLATVHAARKEHQRAYEVFAELLALRDGITGSDWLIYGRLLADLGFPREAKKAFSKIPADKDALTRSTSAQLAKRWSKRILRRRAGKKKKR